MDVVSGITGTYYGRYAQLACHDGRMADAPASVGDNGAGDLHDRFPVRVGDVGDQHLAALGADGSATFYRDRLAGVYEPEPLAGVPAGAGRLVAFDLDNDSRTDLLALGAGGVTYLRNQRPSFAASALAGGALLVVADTLARTLLAPRQLPVGALTAAPS